MNDESNVIPALTRLRNDRPEAYDLVRLYYLMLNETEAGSSLLGGLEAKFLSSHRDAASAGFKDFFAFKWANDSIHDALLAMGHENIEKVDKYFHNCAFFLPEE